MLWKFDDKGVGDLVSRCRYVKGQPLKLLRIGAKLRSICLNENQKRTGGKVGTLIIKWHWLSDGGHKPTTYLHLNRGCRLIFWSSKGQNYAHMATCAQVVTEDRCIHRQPHYLRSDLLYFMNVSAFQHVSQYWRIRACCNLSSVHTHNYYSCYNL